MREQDRSTKLEKVQRRRLSFANRLRLYGALAGTLGLIALAAVGCGGKGSSGGEDGTPHNSGNTPVLPGATDTGENAPTYSDDGQKELEDYVDQQREEDEQTIEGLSSDTIVDVELYTGDGPDTYTDRMSVEEMKALCEEERQETIEEAEAAGTEIIAGPIIVVPYTVVGSDLEQHEYSCGQP